MKNTSLSSLLLRYKSRIRNTIYHLRSTNWKLLIYYINQSKKPYLLFDMLKASWNNGASFNEFFEFKFFEKAKSKRRLWLTTSLRLELTNQLNKRRDAIYFKDKKRFIKKFKALLGRRVYSWNELLKLKNSNKKPLKILAKPRYGGNGSGIVLLSGYSTWKMLVKDIIKQKLDSNKYIFDTYINNQHKLLNNLNPHCINTIRINTIKYKKRIHFLSYCLRMSQDNNFIDNFGCGGLAAAINPEGKVFKSAIVRNPFFNKQYAKHPLTNNQIVGINIPFWEEIKKLILDAHSIIPGIKTVGWDIAIKTTGPCLIEGNSSWGPTSFQLPINKGMRKVLSKYANLSLVYD